jgi:murein DD-endopeptidase MepM/ murein hydrolase activator NlpD
VTLNNSKPTGGASGVSYHTILTNYQQPMQQVAKRQHNRKPKLSLPSFLLIAGLTLMGIITFSLATNKQVSASDLRPTQVSRANTWNTASFPVENFLAYTSPFGYRSSATGGYGTEFHSGLDMAAPEGSYIRNWWTGQVVEVSDDTACGTAIKIQSGDWMHVYCHMQGHTETSASGRYLIDREGGIQLWEGQQVPTGARIGRVGMSGRTTGPHLHWGVKYANEYIDPARVLKAMYNQQTGSAAANYQQQRD